MSLDNGHYFRFKEDKKMLWRFQYNLTQELSKTGFQIESLQNLVNEGGMKVKIKH